MCRRTKSLSAGRGPLTVPPYLFQYDDDLSMTDIRTENEIKLYSDGGIFAFSEDPADAMRMIGAVLSKTGFRCGEREDILYIDDYYTDVGDTFDSKHVSLRYRDSGMMGAVILKLPGVTNGMGLSRRQVKTEVLNIPGMDRIKALQDHADRYLGHYDIDPIPKVRVDVSRIRCPVRSEAMGYTMDFDRVVFRDPASGKRSVPVYELEFESMDRPIGDDRQMMRLVSTLVDDYLFSEEKVSKYVRGRAWVRSLAHRV